MPDQHRDSGLVRHIRATDRLIGILDLQSAHAQRFTDDDLRVMSVLAGQLAVAVQNARLYAGQVQVAEKLRAVDTMKSQFLASMSHELRTPERVL